MKNFLKTVAPFLLSLVVIVIGFMTFMKVYAAVVTPAFPAALNLFTEGEVIEEEDWNAIEIRIGETGTTTRSTITYQLNQLMGTSTLPSLTTVGALISGSIASGFGTISTANTITTTVLGTFGNLLVNASSTLQNFTFINATGTSATTTNFFATNASTTEFRTNTSVIGALTVGTCTGCAGTPGGSDTHVQFNDSSAFGGDAGFVYNKTTDLATLTNLINTKATSTSATTTNFFSTTASSTNLFASVFNFGASTISLIGNTITGLGIWDLGGASSVEIPNGASPTTDAAGEIAVDTTSGQLHWYDGARQHQITGTSTKSINIASTTMPVTTLGTGFKNGTSTFWMMTTPQALTGTGVYCVASSSGVALIRLGDQSGNYTNTITCDTGATRTLQSLTTNNTWTAGEDITLQASSTSGVVQRIGVTFVHRLTAD